MRNETGTPLRTDLHPAEAGEPSPTERRPETQVDPDALAERYVGVWMERDPAARRRRIQELWAPDGAQILEPPQAMREAARSLGFPHPALEVRGHDALEFRVTRAHEEFVATGEFVFQAHGHAVRLHDVLKFRWEMRSTADGAVAGQGLDFLVLDGRERVRVDYQFIER